MASSRRTGKKEGRTGRKRLGRGLDSLLRAPVSIDAGHAEPDKPGTAPADRPEDSSADDSGKGAASGGAASGARPSEGSTGNEPEGAGSDESAIRFLAVNAIDVNRHQPRQAFDEAALDELAASIRSAGLMQPIVVRPAGDGRFELIAGERRWRAVQRIDLREIPAIVRDVDDQTAAEWALVENLQREDLNPMERAEAFGRLRDQFDLTHQEIADRVGLNRATVNNIIRLNELEDEIKDSIRQGGLSLGHAKALLAITNSEARLALARRAIREQWSVRAVEKAAAEAGRGARENVTSDAAREDLNAAAGEGEERSIREAHVRDLEQRLSAHLGTRVHIRPNRKKGTGSLVLEFYSLEQFEGLLDRLGMADDPS